MTNRLERQVAGGLPTSFNSEQVGWRERLLGDTEHVQCDRDNEDDTCKQEEDLLLGFKCSAQSCASPV